MNINDWIGIVGSLLMLLAFILNIIDKIDDDDLLYILLNFFGAGIACYASYMIPYYPFVVLEGVWTLVSAWGIYDYIKRYIKRHINEIR